MTKIENLEISEIKFSDGCGQPKARGNFRSGWWAIECRGTRYRVYATVSSNYDYTETIRDLMERFHRNLSSGVQVELANHPNR